MLSRNSFEKAMTLSPLIGLYPPSLSAPFESLIISVPYKASYRLPHLALVAFSANLAFITGTTS